MSRFVRRGALPDAARAPGQRRDGKVIHRADSRRWRAGIGMTISALMCGRVIQAKGPVSYGIVDGLNVRDSRLDNYPRRWNGCPSQELLVIRQNPKTGERSLDLLKWGLIPSWTKDPKGGRKPINAKSETVAQLPMFRDAYRERRCILPVDGFYEWMATKGGKQPYAIAMKDRSPFGIAGIWENWKSPDGQWVRTFALLTTDANDLVARIHDRMPAILKRSDYERWLGPEPDPHDLLSPLPSEPMTMWPISKRVNSPANDDEDLLTEIAVAEQGNWQ
jgi:putative SOS response-associated peptidase YedK